MKLYSFLVFFVLVLCVNSTDFSLEYTNDNSILFADRGRLANSLAFVHVKFQQEYETPLKLLDQMIQQVKTSYNEEMVRTKRANLTSLDFAAVDSIWNEKSKMIFLNRSQDSAFVLLHIWRSS